MFSETLKNQDFAIRILAAHRRKNRLAHTYLLTGGEDASRKEIAAAFACILTDPGIAEIDSPDPVRKKRICDGNDPDVRWLGEDDKIRSLKIAEVRDIIAWSALRPYAGDWKILIICGADRLTTDAQNALLKTLEEPPAKTIYCLLVNSRNNLLETICSRSFEIRLRPMPRDAESEAERDVPEGLGQKKWDDLLEDYQGMSKDKVGLFLDELMNYFRSLLEVSAESGRSAACRQAWIETLEYLYETKEALDSNANQKLALTRLAVRLKQTLPNAQMLKVE